MTVVSQYGAVAVTHPALLVHAATHTGGYSDVLHAVVAPVQAEVSVCVHWTQSLVAVSHAGRAPEQLALLVHSTQVPVVVLQVGVAPVHAVVSLAVHCTHALVAVSHAVRVPLPAQGSAARKGLSRREKSPLQKPLPRNSSPPLAHRLNLLTPR